jgi:hypothetical protein
MTKFTQSTFSVGEQASSKDDPERQARWANTFPNCCRPCLHKGWVQTPMRNVQCPRCDLWFCREHMEEHACGPRTP